MASVEFTFGGFPCVGKTIVCMVRQRQGQWGFFRSNETSSGTPALVKKKDGWVSWSPVSPTGTVLPGLASAYSAFLLVWALPNSKRPWRIWRSESTLSTFRQGYHGAGSGAVCSTGPTASCILERIRRKETRRQRFQAVNMRVPTVSMTVMETDGSRQKCRPDRFHKDRGYGNRGYGGGNRVRTKWSKRSWFPVVAVFLSLSLSLWNERKTKKTFSMEKANDFDSDKELGRKNQ